MRKTKPGSVVYVRVNALFIGQNQQDKGTRPVLTITQNGQDNVASWARITGPSRMVYKPVGALPCGSRVWLETDSVVEYGEGEPPLDGK